MVAALTLVRVVYGRRIDLGAMDYKMLILVVGSATALTAILGGLNFLGRGEYFCLVESFSRRGLLAFAIIIGGTMFLLFTAASACFVFVLRYVRTSLAQNNAIMNSRGDSFTEKSSSSKYVEAGTKESKGQGNRKDGRLKAFEEAENRIITYLAVHLVRIIGALCFFVFFCFLFFFQIRILVLAGVHSSGWIEFLVH
jgi:drug/metabolite transporter (DMT)-like permease